MNPASDRRATTVAALVVALLPWAVHAELVSSQRFLYALDAGQSFFARFALLGQALRGGHWPLWQDLAYAGSPFLANPENPVLYPPAALAAALLSPVAALNLTSLAHLSWAAVGALLAGRRLARRAGLDPALWLGAGCVAALLFALNGFTRLEHLNLVTYGAAHAWLPWIVLAVDALLVGPAPRRAAGWLALTLALQVTTGGLYVSVYTALGLALVLGLTGLFGGRPLRRRAWLDGAAVAVLALAITVPRWQPVADWVAHTNRAGALPLDEALGRTLAGYPDIGARRLALKLADLSGWGLGLALVLPALARWRRPVVGLLLGLLLLGLLIALGPGYAWLHEHLPPFDHVRGARRGWTLANLAWPLLAGLGAAQLWQTLIPGPWRRGSSSAEGVDPFDAAVTDDFPPAQAVSRGAATRPVLALPLLAAAVLLPALLVERERAEDTLTPYRLDHVLSLYPNWTELAARAGDDGRVAALNVRTAGSRNEQFISAALDVESPAGFMGFAWPVDLARHLYNNFEVLEPKQRLRRGKALSVHHATFNQHMAPRAVIWEDRANDPFPGGVDGPLTWSDERPRPRAFLPSGVVAVIGVDPERAATYALYDLEAWPLDRACLVALEPAPDGSAAALPPAATLAGAVVLPWPSRSTDDGAAARALVAELRARGRPVVEVEGPRPRRADVLALQGLARRLTDELGAAPTGARFTRLAPGAVRVDLPPADHDRWLVLSETWQLWGGWSVRAGGRELDQRRADGIATAVLVPAGVERLEARYEPAGMTAMLWIGMLAALAALALALWPERAAATRTESA